VQLPLYNERYVAERAIEAVTNLDYPTEQLEIQVLDDSTDDTPAVVERAMRSANARGVRVTHIRRSRRIGFKAGALAHGLTRATGQLVAIFDADFVPPSDFLTRLVGEFSDPSVGMVQARWGHLNGPASLLTKVQALQLDAHFTIEHGVRAATRCFFNFNGTAGIWRREAIETAGGWRADTLTEDLDLSYRAQLAGWRFVYRDDVAAPAELPVEIAAYRVQQQRWAQGGVQTAVKLLPAIMQSSLPGRVKREAAWQLTGHFAYPFFVLLAVAGLSLGWVAGVDYRPWLFGVDGFLLTFATASLAFFYGVAAYARTRSRWLHRLRLIPFVMVLGAGIALGQSAAVLRGILRHPTPFRRTPKYRQDGTGDASWQHAAYRIRGYRPALIECVAGVAVISAGTAAIVQGVVVPPGPVALFGFGFLTTGIGSLIQQRHGRSTEVSPTGLPATEVSQLLSDRCA
jgi:cellulose synthase/poly-beta-1,6-N-acetylglucosamine synthase-like glycosyltransferase